jgi:N utilization substance protein B
VRGRGTEVASGARRQAREAALQVLFAADVAECLEPGRIEEIYQEVLEEFQLPPRARERAHEIVMGVVLNRKPIDEGISAASTRWKLHRIATVDRNVLRIATYELLFEPETPAEVVIDEAVEIARRFSGADSSAFTNGVLDVIARGRTDVRS